MKLKRLFLTGALMMAMSVSAVSAEEPVSEGAAQEEASGSFLASLFGEGGILEGTIPEDVDVDVMAETLKEQLGQADSEISTVLGAVIEKAENEIGSIDTSALEGIAGDLLGMVMGGGDDFDFGELDAYFELSSGLRDAEKQYILDHNAELMDPGDVHIITDGSLCSVEYGLEDPEIKCVNAMVQNNYTLDDEDQLWFTSGAKDIILYTHERDEEGNYPVTDAVFAEDGENYMPSIEAMYEEVGQPFDADECMDSIEFTDVMVLYDLSSYLEEHPEIKGIEYDGEIRTEQELSDLWSEKLDELYPPEEDAVTEDAGSVE